MCTMNPNISVYNMILYTRVQRTHIRCTVRFRTRTHTSEFGFIVHLCTMNPNSGLCTLNPKNEPIFFTVNPKMNQSSLYRTWVHFLVSLYKMNPEFWVHCTQTLGFIVHRIRARCTKKHGFIVTVHVYNEPKHFGVQFDFVHTCTTNPHSVYNWVLHNEPICPNLCSLCTCVQ